MPFPQYKVTKAKRKKVCMLVAAGMGERQIAKVMKTTQVTLAKYFQEELQDGRALFRAEILEQLKSAADAGNVSAMKHLDSRTADSSGAAVTYQGKKIERARAAEEVMAGGSDWGDDLAPIVVPQRTN